MISRLTVGMDADEKEQFQYEWEKSLQFRKRVSQLLKEREEQLISSMISEENYSKEWPHLQATRVAQLKEIRSLLTLLK